jgi:kynurenine--oxoglutarate transaminase/cysteine-S-conjugate beta-lyase/glutamine--phenylpyruvate transaminase/kynurenine aminotransferase
LKDKTICVISAGKMFSATGLRVGFAIGNEKVMNGIKAA